MGSGDYPLVIQQCTPTRQFLGEETRLDERHLPGMAPEVGVVASHNTVTPRVQLSTCYNRQLTVIQLKMGGTLF